MHYVKTSVTNNYKISLTNKHLSPTVLKNWDKNNFTQHSSSVIQQEPRKKETRKRDYNLKLKKQLKN